LLESAQANRSPVPSGWHLGAEQEPVPCVYLEQSGGGASRRRHAGDLGAQPGEVVVPLLLARLEEGHRAAGVRIEAVEIHFRPKPNSLLMRTTLPPRMWTSMSLELPTGLPVSSLSVAICFFVRVSKTSGV